jgi:hypothetical protein
VAVITYKHIGHINLTIRYLLVELIHRRLLELSGVFVRIIVSTWPLILTTKVSMSLKAIVKSHTLIVLTIPALFFVSTIDSGWDHQACDMKQQASHAYEPLSAKYRDPESAIANLTLSPQRVRAIRESDPFD